jgi:hypothetical protein
VQNGVLKLSQGQYITLKEAPSAPYLAGVSLFADIVGNYTIQMTGYAYDGVSRGDITIETDNEPIVYRFLTHAISPSLRIVANGDCSIRQVSFDVIEL